MMVDCEKRQSETYQMIANLSNQLRGYANDIRMDHRQPLDQMSKFRGLMLVSEIYEYARKFNGGRKERLAHYFGNETLSQVLSHVADIESLQQYVSQAEAALENESKQMFEFDTSGICYKEMEVLYNEGPDGLRDFQDDNTFSPIKMSNVWEVKAGHKKYRQAFYKAHEDFTFSSALPAPLPGFINENLCDYPLLPPCPDIYPKAQNLDVMNFLIGFQKASEALTYQDIFNEMNRGLEMLRMAFMTEAHDIYCIRTGSSKIFSQSPDAEALKEYYTDVPLSEYYIFRDSVQEDIRSNISRELDEWRVEKKYTGRPLSESEYQEYLSWRIDNVLHRMQDEYAQLWELREHSGGLDAEVNPESFARMFYRRDVEENDFYFLECELELLRELKKESETASLEPSVTQSTPEQIAVREFVDDLMVLTSQLYDLWNDKTVSAGAHKAEVCITIRKVELIDYLQEQQQNHFAKLQALCYPADSKTKQQFCEYVMELKNKGFFGNLPNTLLARTLAPIVKLNESTVKNYLSKH